MTLRKMIGLGAAAGLLASSAYAALPAFGAGEADPTPAPSAGAGATAAAAEPTSTLPTAAPPSGSATSSGLSEAALADAVQRDLKLTPQQFEAAGELGAQAAAAAVRLRDVPGYAGIRIEASSIVVTGSGSELQAAVAALAGSIHGLSLEAPPAGPSAAAAAGGSRSELAVSTEQLYQEYVRQVGTAGLQAVVTAGGKFVIRTGSIASAQSTEAGGTGTATNPPGAPDAAAPGKISPSEFVSRYANVELDGAAPLKPEADVPGGVGYQTDRQAICSTGFSAFDPAGLPAVLTAGHCTDDGAAQTADLLFQGVPNGRLGSFVFSQFGGPGNTTVLNPNSPQPGNVGTDIAVLGNIRQDLDPLPAASTYGDPATPGPDVKIIGTSAPVVGMPVCRSGWRTGWSCGHISAVGIFLVGGHTYPADPTDIRAFNGFLSYDVQSNGGDSGGPWISGNFGVGTHSAGEWGGPQNFAVAATLEDSLRMLPGYQLELFLNKPELLAPADRTVKAGTSITGRVPAAPASAVAAGSKVRITYAGRQPFDVPVDAAGNWSFTAPEAPGPFSFTAETVNGFSRSGAVSLDIVISPSFLPAPTITTPASQPLPRLQTVEGTGTPGATVTLSGGVSGAALVGVDGRWSVALAAPAPYGRVAVTAVQSYPGLADSPADTASFAVMPPPPAVTIPSDGQHLVQDALPATIAGTGLDGADVTVSVDGQPVTGTVVGGAAGSRSAGNALAPLVLVTGGGWSAPFPSGLAVGSHTVSVTQAVDGVASAPVGVTFSVDAPPVHLASTGGNPANPAGLARTGSSGLLPAAIAAVTAIVVGAVLTVVVRRRNRGRAK
ncbi:S1 family peptidase [Arthrobacter sp. C152]